MWGDTLARLEAELDVPYPARARLLEELEADLDAAYAAHRGRGLADGEARAAALAEAELDAASLADVHAPAVRRALERLSPPARDWFERIAAGAPLLLLFVWLHEEVPMAHFLREGGNVIYPVLAIGLLGLFLQLHRVFLWFVLRDHSPAALRRNTATPLYLAAATFLLGFLATAVGYYAVLHTWAEGQLPADAVKVGLREPLACVIVGTSLAALIVLVHGAMQAGLRALRVPERKGAAS